MDRSIARSPKSGGTGWGVPGAGHLATKHTLARTTPCGRRACDYVRTCKLLILFRVVRLIIAIMKLFGIGFRGLCARLDAGKQFGQAEFPLVVAHC